MVEEPNKMKNSFKILSISKVFVLLIFLFLLVSSTYATDWCQKSDANVIPCENGIIPENWVWCGNFTNESIWCDPSMVVNSDTDDGVEINKQKPPHRFYAGFSLGYVASLSGGMTADYIDQQDSWIVPGSFDKSVFQIDKKSVPIQFSVGARIIETLSIAISYTDYSGISMPELVSTATGGRNGFDGYFPFHETGGKVSGDAVMLNTYYNLEHLTGRFIGGKISPYIGAGIGLGTNEISDYVVYDDGVYDVDEYGNGSGNINATHFGGKTQNNLVYMFEAGGTTKLFDRVLLDLFIRWTSFGQVKTNGEVLLTQTVWENSAPVYDETLRYDDKRESGTLNITDVGVRLKFLF